MRRLVMSRLIRIFTICFVKLFLYCYNYNHGTNKIEIRNYLMSEVSRLYPSIHIYETTCTFTYTYLQNMEVGLYGQTGVYAPSPVVLDLR